MKKVLQLLKNHQRLLAFILLFLWLFSTWYLFFYLGIVKDFALQIAASISYLGFGFALFQFWFNYITNENRRVYDMRYNAYKEVVSQIDAVFETVNLNLNVRKANEIQNLIARLRNQINKFYSTMSVNSYFHFPEITNKEEAKNIRQVLSMILSLTETFELNIQSAERRTAFEEIYALNWHNAMTINLNELTDISEEFYAKLREYLR